MRPRLWRLLREFQWDRMDRVYGEIIGQAGLPAARLSVVPV
jgi:hypothetical protein